MILRDYQEECCKAIMAKFEVHQSTMAVLFTSGGKTVIFSHIINQFLPRRVLVIAGQDALIWQAKRTLARCTKGTCGVEMAENRADLDPSKPDQIVLATWQTLISGGKPAKEGTLFNTPSKRRMHKWKPTDFDLIVIDEFHHAAARSFKLILDYFKQNSKIKILGVTATPKRGDGLALGEVCESVAYEYHILQGLLDGWLVDIVQHSCPVGGLDYGPLNTNKGDFNGPELKALLEKQEIVAGMVHPLLEVMFGLEPHDLDKIPVAEWGKFLLAVKNEDGTPFKVRKTLLFTHSVAQAELFCEVLNRIIPGLSEWVCGKTKKEDRAEIFDRFEKGETALLANVGITVEGYDCPPIEIIAMGRPTLSLTTFIQMLGRGIRVLPGTVEGLKTKEERLAAIASSAKPRLRVIDFKGNTGRHNLITTFDVLGGRMSDKTQQAKKRAASSDRPKSVLVCLSVAEQELEKKKQAEIELKKKLDADRRTELVPKSHFQMHEVSAFKNNGHDKPMPKHCKQPGNFSEKMRKILLRNGFPPEKLTMAQGRHIMGVLAKNNWRLPAKEREWANSFKNHTPTHQPMSMEYQAKLDWDNYQASQVMP